MSTGLGSLGLYLPAAGTGYFSAGAALALVLGACIGGLEQLAGVLFIVGSGRSAHPGQEARINPPWLPRVGGPRRAT
jgi:hypothetical protein